MKKYELISFIIDFFFYILIISVLVLGSIKYGELKAYADIIKEINIYEVTNEKI